MNESNRCQLVADEGLIIRHSGEIPEIAYYNSCYHLTADPEGPGLLLEPGELGQLREQVVARYREIMLRDLTPANRDRTLYRGIRRVIWNWQRLEKFFSRHELPTRPELTEELVAALRFFLNNEAGDVRAGLRPSSLNCTATELAAFLAHCQLDQDPGYRGWLELCC